MAADAPLDRPGGAPAVTHKVEAFIRQVYALTPKHIADSASSSLIDFAQEIVHLLGDAPSATLAPVSASGRRGPVTSGRSR